MKRVVSLLLILLFSPCVARARVVDRVAAVVEHEVITVSEISQLVGIRFFAHNEAESDEAYRRRSLDAMIAQSLRFRDVQRFGAQDISRDAIEARLLEIEKRFVDQPAFDRALASSELTLDEVRSLVKRQLQVEAYIAERFSPLIFVSLDEIEKYHREVWSPQRARRGLPPVALADAREEIRTALKSERLGSEVSKWTQELRDRANVDVYAWK